jgi:hypothetical protein
MTFQEIASILTSMKKDGLEEINGKCIWFDGSWYFIAGYKFKKFSWNEAAAKILKARTRKSA